MPIVKQIKMSDSKLFNSMIDVDSKAFEAISLTIWSLESYVRFGYTFCVFDDGIITGVVAYMRIPNSFDVYLVSMAIDPKKQNKQHGSLLLERSLCILKEQNIETVYLHVDPLNLPAMHLYINKFSFEFISYHDNEYGLGEDRAYLGLVLKHFAGHYSYKTHDISLAKKQSELSRSLSIRLRQSYYKNIEVIEDIRTKPLYGIIADGMPTESLGPFPEFILPTHSCENSLLGFCSPCFFSKHPKTSLSDELVYESLITQTQHIIDNFDELVINFQQRESKCRLPNVDVTLCYACNGSFFSDRETHSHHREQALKMIANEIEKRDLKPIVYIETCSSDFNRLIENGELDELLPLLQKLNTVILFGFESVSDYTRNVLYNKNLKLESFEKSINICQQLGLGYGAFVYTGFYAMTDYEIIADVTSTLLYLRRLGAIPVLMFPNIQHYSLYHLLYKCKSYNLYDPRTALKIFQIMIKIFANTNNKYDKWLTGDLFGGPPTPPVNVFLNKERSTCDKCTELIRLSILKMKKNHESEQFFCSLNSIDECDCRLNYENCMDVQKKMRGSTSIIERAGVALAIAEKNLDEYIADHENTKKKRKKT